MKEKVILTKAIGNEEVDILRKKYNLIIVENEREDLPGVLRNHSDAEALITFLSDKIDMEVISLLKNVKIIANYAVGYNNIDFKCASDLGIYVTNTPDILTDATADLTIMLILSVARRIIESDNYMRSGKFEGWGANLLLGKELKGMKLGIIGLGKIGFATALRARSFGMKIIYNSRTRKIDIERDYDFSYSDIDTLISGSDIISLHIPYIPDLHHMFNAEVFKSMKKGSIFINVSRGGLMDESALADNLENGHLFGAGLDVFENEPEVEKRLTLLKNVVMTPHTGSATYEARSGMGKMVITNIEHALSGKIPKNLIPELQNMIK